MPLSRTNRIDRRRRVLLDAVAADSEFAVDSVRAKRKVRSRESGEGEDVLELPAKYRDPGYSQAVRKTCQQRMVQLIPVRRGTLSIVLTAMWLLWGGLLVAHYAIFTSPSQNATATATSVASTGPSSTPTASVFATTPIAQLFHLRSPHSIAQWLNGQLWMLTAVAAWMIFQLRRHKLDDYRARYRIWVVLAVAAAFSSFEASSSGLLLLGMSLDGWAKKEIGYAGFPLVLATFASIVGVLGIRLCSELKSAPTSVVSWMLGLVAWGIAALVGNGLLKLSWAPSTIDLVVGACSLGGILAVFQAAGIYLRQTYIHAQKRFLVRNGANLAPIQWKVPKLSLRRKRPLDSDSQNSETKKAKSEKSQWKMPWPKKRAANATQDRTLDENNERQIERPSQRDSENVASRKSKGRLFGFIPHRKEQNEKLDAEPIREDDGPTEDLGLTKKRGWFGIGGNRDLESSPDAASRRSTAKPASVNKSTSQTHDPSAKEERGETSKPSEKKSFWSRKPASTSDQSESGGANSPRESKAPKEPKAAQDLGMPKQGWISKFSKSAQRAKAEAAGSSTPSAAAPKQPVSKPAADPVGEAKPKKPWLSFAPKTKKEPQAPKPVAKKPDPSERASGEEPSKPARRGLFGMLDGLKLKPPSDESQKQTHPPATKPVPIKQGQAIPSTQADHDDEDDEDDSGRPMSKADRKRLRRQNQDDRRAA